MPNLYWKLMMAPDRQPLLSARHPDGKKIGSTHRNPMFDTRKYFVEFPDRSQECVMADIISLNLYEQCNSEGTAF